MSYTREAPLTNRILAVGEGGFEPPASCTQSRCATTALLPGVPSPGLLLSYCPVPAGGPGRTVAAARSVDSASRMKTVVEPLEGNKVKLSVEVDEQEFEKALDAAFRKIAREVRIPGFRPGKAPRRVLEARHGQGRGPPGGAAGRAARLLRPGPPRPRRRRHRPARDRHHRRPGDGPGGLRRRGRGPAPAPAGRLRRPAGRRCPNPEVDRGGDHRPRSTGSATTSASCPPVGRPARDGDHLTIDLKGTRDGEPVAGHDAPTTSSTSWAAAPSCPSSTTSSRGPRPATSSASTPSCPTARSSSRCWSRRSRRRSSPRSPTSGPARRRSSTPSRSCGPTSSSGSALVKRVQAPAGAAQPGGRGAGRAGDRGRRPSRWSTPSSSAGPTTSSTGSRPRAPPSPSTSRPPARPRSSSSPSCGQAATQAVKADLALRAVADAEEHRGRPTTRSTPRSPGWPSGSGRSRPSSAPTRARRPDARGTLGCQEEQGVGVARRPRRGRRRGGSPHRPSPVVTRAPSRTATAPDQSPSAAETGEAEA